MSFDDLDQFEDGYAPAVATAPPARRPTPQQEALYDAVRTGTEHVAVEAVAGAGKTTSAVEAAGVAAGRVGFVAFNKHIADELAMRLNGKATACTLHSAGFAAIRKAFGSVDVDGQKPKRILERIRPRWVTVKPSGRVVCWEEGQATLELSRHAKLSLVDPDNNEALTRLARHHGILFNDPIRQAVREMLDESVKQTAIIDYDDMIWMPVRLALPGAFSRFDVLMVDEVQDLSGVQQGLAAMLCRDGRMIPIGDPAQSIYGFTGADPKSFPRLKQYLAGQQRLMVEKPLTVTFRCPRSHVDLAQKLVSHIEPAPWAREGEVNYIEGDADLAPLVDVGDLIVCRTNAPLVSCTYRLIRAGVPARMLGRDIGKGLTDLIDQFKATSAVELARAAAAWKDREVRRLEQRDAPDGQIQAVIDRANCLMELTSTGESPSEIRALIVRMFSDNDDSAVVTLSSVHKAKGTEADNVFILCPQLLPLTGRKQQPWEYQQELNIAYVAVTRAKKSLTFMGELPLIFQ
jgi:DNA helicase-2/ATP-dependent DNA helicase PcrA